MQSRTIALWSATLLAAAGATLAAVVPTVARIEEPWNIAVVSELLVWLRLTFIVALLHAVILGLPLFLALRARFSVGIVACALGGFGVGAIGIAILGLLGMFGNGSYNASTGGVPTIVNGGPTLAGLLEYALSVGMMGLVGLAGGLTFWLAMRLSGQPPSRSNAEGTPLGKFPTMSRIVAGAAIISTCAALILPSVVKDTSCHNIFRDGRTSLVPQISADVNLTGDDWPGLAQIFTDFARDHSLSLRNDQQIRRGQLMWRNLDLCNENGVSIKILDRPWLDRMPSAPAIAKGIKLSIFELKAGSGWNPLAHDLLDKFDARWSEKITFRGPNGKAISEADALKGRQ